MEKRQGATPPKTTLRLAIGAALILSIALAFTGCGGGQAAVRTDTLIVGVPSMPVNLDPSLVNDIPSGRLIFHIYDTLIYIDYDTVPQPNLATSWEWLDPDNPQQLRVFLREGVLFHNGDLLTARDVAFSLDRASEAPTIASLAGMIESTTIVNDHEVIINLEYPFVPFVTFLGHTAFSILNERAVTEMGVDAHSQAPVGTGPYRLTNIVTGDRLEFTRWDYFWGEPALIENLVIRILPDASTRLIALETGEIDIMEGVPPPDMNRVRSHPDLTLFHEMTFGTNYIAFNVSRPPFDDIRVRHAVQYAIDLEAMVQAVYMGAMLPGTGPLGPMVWASIADQLEGWDFNPQRARELLAEAGFPDGFSATFMTNQGNPQRADTGEILQNMLGAVGIDVSVQLLEWATFLDVSAQGEPDMHMLGWSTSTGDPDHGLFAMFHSSTWGHAGNRSFFSHPEVDSLLEAGRLETDPVARAQIYAQAQRIIHQESPWIFQSTASEIYAVRNNVQGFRMSPDQRHKFWTLSFTN
ncbi:MAG: ABC transporter substrate-binding protein [Spirochaetes bacterium]|nr:ABC transporter substrate-binding protein [Spirochaetota bacterium]